MNKINFPLDNLAYNLVINDKQDLQLILPHYIPNVENKETSENVIYPVSPIRITVFIDINTDTTPKITVVGEDEKSEIITSGSFDFSPNSTAAMYFTTANGGLTWFVNSTALVSGTAESAEAAAIKAQETADKATELANTATETAASALNTATESKTSSTKATEIANTAIENANTATNIANAATEKANTAIGTANEAKTVVTNSEKQNVKLFSDTAQVVDSDLVVGKGKKLFVQTSNNDTPLAVAANKYDTGLEQFEVGTPKLPMCLNHCGTTTGETIDKHIKVDYKESLESPVQHDKIAYMSDIETLNILVSTLQKKITELEGKIQE